uniref:Uncharacterized protein n=1 Tax=Anguilla anguilla TaxID=7936 RepID=A0A0E9Q602_ANGAN
MCFGTPFRYVGGCQSLLGGQNYSRKS